MDDKLPDFNMDDVLGNICILSFRHPALHPSNTNSRRHVVATDDVPFWSRVRDLHSLLWLDYDELYLGGNDSLTLVFVSD